MTEKEGSGSRPRFFVDALARGLPGFMVAPRARRVRRAAGVAAYVGPNGSGKSLLMAYDTLPTLAGVPWYCDNDDHFHTAAGITSGVRGVLSTMRFLDANGDDHPLWTPLNDFKQLVRAEHVDLVLDEVAGVANSRDANSLPTAVQATLQELRRRDVLCRFSAPGWMRADKVLRECAQAVTLCLGFVKKAHDDKVWFPGAHDGCTESIEHVHDAGRQWMARRLTYARTFDANLFDEWSSAKRETVKPIARSLMWIPGSEAGAAYDSHAYVEKLGQVTESGMCLDCGGRRRPLQCACESPTTRRARTRVSAEDARSLGDHGSAVPV
jgi:hypothetical protein